MGCGGGEKGEDITYVINVRKSMQSIVSQHANNMKLPNYNGLSLILSGDLNHTNGLLISQWI